MGHYRPLFSLSSFFQTNIQQINVEKSPSRIQCWDSNSRPLEHESPPICTRPGLPPEKNNFFFLIFSSFFLLLNNFFISLFNFLFFFFLYLLSFFILHVIISTTYSFISLLLITYFLFLFYFFILYTFYASIIIFCLIHFLLTYLLLLTLIKIVDSSGIRTRIVRKEGEYAHHLTTTTAQK